MKLKINGNGFKDLDNPNIWYSNENSDVIQWLSEGNTPEPEFTKEELAKQELDKQIAEAKAYLANTDYKMLPNYVPKANEDLDAIIVKRNETREFIRNNNA